MRRLSPAVEERIRWAEHRVSWVRLAITLVGVAIYPWMAPATSSLAAAVSVLGFSLVYSISGYLISRRPDYPVLPMSYAVVALDLGLTLASLAVTGGVLSPVMPAVFLVVFSFAFRYPPRETLLGGLAAAAGYCAVAAKLGQLSPQFGNQAMVHVAYLAVAALLGALISREALTQRVEKRELAELMQSRVQLAHESAARALAEQAVQQRDEFLSIASHELKTPLTALTLDVEFLGQLVNAKSSDQEALDYRAGRIERGVHCLNRLVFSLLDVSRLVAGRMDLERQSADLCALVRDAASRANGQLAEAGSALELNLAAAVVGKWDALRVEQIIDNLLGNAVKYGEGKPIQISVQATPEGEAVLRVVDQGIGIAPEDQQRIFSRFERAVPSRQSLGLGLGLWITRQIVVAMGGTISVTSQLGKGSEFQVRLPLVPPSRPSAPRPSSKTPDLLPDFAIRRGLSA